VALVLPDLKVLKEPPAFQEGPELQAKMAMLGPTVLQALLDHPVA